MSQYQSNPGYDVDIVLCIDGTASMNPIMDRIKSMAMQFPAMYAQAMREGQKTPRSLYVKVLVFRDFLKNDGAYDDAPFEDSGEFFDLMSDGGSEKVSDSELRDFPAFAPAEDRPVLPLRSRRHAKAATSCCWSACISSEDCLRVAASPRSSTCSTLPRMERAVRPYSASATSSASASTKPA